MNKIREWINQPKSATCAYFAFAMVLGASVYEAEYFAGFPFFEFVKFLFAVFSVAFASGFFFLFKNKFVRALGVVFFALTMGLSFFYAGHHLIYGTPPTSNVYVSLFETNASETSEFLDSYITSEIILGLILQVVVGLLLFFGLKYADKKIHRKYQWASLVFFILTFISVENLRYKSPYRFVNQYLIYKSERQAFRDTFSVLPPEDLKITANKGKTNDTIILVVGESLSRRRMSLYGYQRETSPLLTAEKKDLFVYENVITPHTHTVPALEKALTFLNFDNHRDLKHNANVIQLAKLAGYKTYWMSNQPPLGRYETPLNTMANNAHQTSWLSDSPSFRYNNNFDGTLVPLLKKKLKKEGKKFIVLHLMGSHTSYKHRYPSKFHKFKNQIEHKLKLSKAQWEEYNNYDNAVLYNDFVVSQIIETAKVNPNTTVVYFSDHGEEVYDDRYVKGHTEAIASNVMFEVPFLTYTNNESLKQTLEASYKDRQNDLWSIEDLIHSLHDVMGIETTYFEAKRSLFSAKYENLPRLAAGKSYRPVSDSVCNAKGMFEIKDKIWLHRVNSIERFEIVKDDYAGFEVDMNFDMQKGYFDVFHPPAKSINLNVASILEKDPTKKRYFWFDVKNLNAENQAKVLAELNKLDSNFQIKNRIIFESDNAEMLKPIAEAGFYTSFYIPSLKTTPAEKVAPRIGSYLKAISQGGNMLELMDADFGGCDKLTWVLGKGFDDKDTIEELKERDDIKVILVAKTTKGRL